MNYDILLQIIYQMTLYLILPDVKLSTIFLSIDEISLNQYVHNMKKNNTWGGGRLG